jgi:hypothetical protein
MQNGNVWELPFSQPAELELRTEWGSLAVLPVEPGQSPRLELSRGSGDNVVVHVEKVGDVVRVALEQHSHWFGGWECRATLYVPHDVRASIETKAGSVSVRSLEGCELGIKADAGKIDLVDVYGLMHLSADAGSINGRKLGGFFDVATQAGSIRLEIVDLKPGEHRVRASMGSIRLELAKGMDVCVETHTSMGSVRNRYPARQSAPAKLALSAEMGSIHVDEGASFSPGRRPDWPPKADRVERPEPPRSPNPDPELERVLKMVEAGELSAQDADELLRAMGRV